MNSTEGTADHVVFTLDGQVYGLPIRNVRDVLNRYVLSPVPLAPDAVAGHLNLRGRIVTAIDLAVRINGPRIPSGRPSNDNDAGRRTALVLEHGAALYALLVDEVREVLPVAEGTVRANPSGCHAAWAALSLGVVTLPAELLVLLDVDRLLSLGQAAA